jgi:hypothetical protein
LLLNNQGSRNCKKHSLIKVRQFSSKTNKEIEYKISEYDLYEWLRGFADGEGCFQISPRINRPFTISFVFRIKLHKDDRPLLEYLTTHLNIGQVFPKDINSENMSSTWEVCKKDDLLKLIKIFDKHPLNTTKYLDFIAWREAFFMYQEMKKASLEIKITIKKKILSLKDQMNKKREYFVLTPDHKINITPYWLLGFIEGEAWFYVNKVNFTLVFGVGQTITQKAVIESIAQFLNNLIPENLPELKNRPNFIRVDKKDSQKNSKPFVYLTISRLDYIINVFIPFLDSLTFISKKGLDYQDWKTVALLRKQGKHLTAEGKVLITNICNRMNSNRLTTKITDSEDA